MNQETRTSERTPDECHDPMPKVMSLIMMGTTLNEQQSWVKAMEMEGELKDLISKTTDLWETEEGEINNLEAAAELWKKKRYYTNTDVEVTRFLNDMSGIIAVVSRGKNNTHMHSMGQTVFSIVLNKLHLPSRYVFMRATYAVVCYEMRRERIPIVMTRDGPPKTLVLPREIPGLAGELLIAIAECCYVGFGHLLIRKDYLKFITSKMFISLPPGVKELAMEYLMLPGKTVIHDILQ